MNRRFLLLAAALLVSRVPAAELAWSNGKLLLATVRNVSGNGPGKVRYGDNVADLALKPGEAKTFDAKL
jgi:alpha-L-fucosidase 2